MSLKPMAAAAGLSLSLWQATGAAVPQTMRAAAIDAAGGPQVITLHTVPVPKPEADDVLIAVDSADVAVWDASVRAHPEELKHAHFPLVLGTDGSGVIAAVGAQVRGFKPGDPVYGYMWDNPKGGFYAEYVAIPAKHVGHLPPGLSLRDAGASAASALTALADHSSILTAIENLRTFGRLMVKAAALIQIQSSSLRPDRCAERCARPRTSSPSS